MKLFLDTSIQIDKWLGHQNHKDAINRVLMGSSGNTTSKYVLGEYKRSIGRDLATFKDLLESSPNVEEALRRLHIFSSRKGSRFINLIFPAIIEELKIKDDTSIEAVLERVSHLLEIELEDFFWLDIDEDKFVNSPYCADADPPPPANDKISCPTNASVPCDIEDFWGKSNCEFLALADNLPSKPKEIRERKSLIKQILQNIKKKHGENCLKLADAIIATQCPEGYQVFTTNMKDFEPICQALGKAPPVTP